MIRICAIIAVLILPGITYSQCRVSRVNFVHQPSVQHVNTVQKINKVVDVVNVKDVAVVQVPLYPQVYPQTVFQYLPALQPQVQLSNQDIDRLVQAKVDKILKERSFSNDSGPPALILRGSVDGNDYTQQVADVLANKTCATCHTKNDTNPVRGDVVLFDKKDGQYFFEPNISGEDIFNAVAPQGPGNRVKMPPAAKGDPQSPNALNAQEIDLIRKWTLQN